MSKIEYVTVKEQDDGIRLNRWFLKYYPNLPLSRLQKLLRTKQIKVDGKKAETSHKLATGQIIRIPPLNDEKMAENNQFFVNKRDEELITSLVIYKDENIIVLNKPSGLAVQGGSGLVRYIDKMLPALCFEKSENPKLVHRIDKDTSGLLVLARDRKNAEILTKAFKDKLITKTYLAIVRGVPPKNKMMIDAPLIKNGEKMAVGSEGQKSLSKIEVIDTQAKQWALVKCEPMTGRKHQLRAHLEYINTPILGDDKYYGKERLKLKDVADKLYLHAYKIDLSSIYKNVIIKADLPKYFNETLQSLFLEFKDF